MFEYKDSRLYKFRSVLKLPFFQQFYKIMNTDCRKSNIFMYLHLYTDQNAKILQRLVWTQITQRKKTFVAAQE